jgi:hypothetical protein
MKNFSSFTTLGLQDGLIQNYQKIGFKAPSFEDGFLVE